MTNHPLKAEVIKARGPMAVVDWAGKSTASTKSPENQSRLTGLVAIQ